MASFAVACAVASPAAADVLLTVNRLGAGGGTVTASPAGIACGSTCSASYAVGARVSLTATPYVGAVFTGWGGACSGMGACVVTLSASTTVTATFAFSSSAYSRDYVQKAYVAYYGRSADPGGQAYWASRMDAEGQSLGAIIGAFGNSDEFNRRYGGLSYAALVTKIYQQALGRDPDQAGLDWYVGELQAGRRTLQSITLDVLNGATTAPDSTVVANKLDVAAYYTAKVAAGCAYGTEQDGVARLSSITASAATVSTAKSSIDSRCTPNGVPQADAGAAQSVVVGKVVALDGSASSDPERDALTYSWTLTAKPAGSAAVLSAGTTARPTFTADLIGTYTASLVVNDNKSNSVPATVTVTALSASDARKDAARFLRQATFGAPREAIDALVAQGYDAWLAEQFAKPTVSHVQTVMADPQMIADIMPPYLRSAWKQRFEGEDQLRQRVSDALLQIFVISIYSNKLRVQAPCAVPGYLDLLNRDAFGNFRDLLRDVTLSPAMGEYLSMKQSTKFDPVGQTQPDENYAREVMQLFTVGLVMLNDDGTVKLGPDGNPQPTFNEDIVKGYANALSGWTFAMDQSQPWGWIGPYFPDPDPVVQLKKNCDVWTKPMEPWLASYRSWDTLRIIPGPAHDQGPKQLLVYPGAPYSTLPAGQSPQADLENVIDNLFFHPNVGPFIGRQLIQRMVTSNPSPAYVARVAAKFNNNGSGVRGDMKAVLRAVLLDDEARNLVVAAQPTFGKLTEPVIRFVQYYRAFNFTTTNYDLGWTMGDWNGFNQQPLRSPSVFNFYRPDYTPAGPLAQAHLVGPEFQITDTSSVSMFGNSSNSWIVAYGWYNPSDPQTLVAHHTYYLGLASVPAQLVDELELVLCASCLNPAVKTRIVQLVSNIASGSSYWGRDVAQERVYTALWLIVNSPDYLVQK